VLPMSESWGAVLDRGAAKLAASIVSDIERVVRSTDAIDVEIVSLTLVYVQDSGSLAGGASLTRRATPTTSHPGAMAGGRLTRSSTTSSLPSKRGCSVARRCMRSMTPVRTVLNATAAVLARHNWCALFPVSDDFVAFIAEHDEGTQEKIESLRACNPPERAEPWVQRLLETESF
jgi:hypothetical protein